MKKIDFPEPGMIFLSKGELETGKPYWAYVMIPVDNIAGYYQARAKGQFNLQDHGHIIYWDEGDEPPKEIRDEMFQLYGTQDDFVEKFMAELEQSSAGRDFIDMVKKEAAKFKPEEGA